MTLTPIGQVGKLRLRENQSPASVQRALGAKKGATQGPSAPRKPLRASGGEAAHKARRCHHQREKQHLPVSPRGRLWLLEAVNMHRSSGVQGGWGDGGARPRSPGHGQPGAGQQVSLQLQEGALGSRCPADASRPLSTPMRTGLTLASGDAWDRLPVCKAGLRQPWRAAVFACTRGMGARAVHWAPSPATRQSHHSSAGEVSVGPPGQ